MEAPQTPRWKAIARRHCLACAKTYQPRSGRQKRCDKCRDAKCYAKGPACACGCQTRTTWLPEQSQWARYTPGHDTRAKRAKPKRKPQAEPTLPRTWTLAVPPRSPKGHRKTYPYTCATCSAKGQSVRPNKQFCNKKCHGLSRRRPGGKAETGRLRGYPVVHHPVTGQRRYKHVVVMEKLMSRSLLPGEVVHHIDNDPRNYDVSNLHVFHCQKCHLIFHRTPGSNFFYCMPTAHPLS